MRAQGIVHVISPEQGVVLPGLTLVCLRIATPPPRVRSALWPGASALARPSTRSPPRPFASPGRATLRITVDGVLGRGVTAKDLALHVLARLSASGARNCIVEYAGEAIRAMPVEGRMTLCNMATELSAFSALIAPDAATFDYLRGRPFAPKGAAWDAALDDWRTLHTDPGAVFDLEHAFDAAEVAPTVTWGVSPQHATAVTGRVPRFRVPSPTRTAARATTGRSPTWTCRRTSSWSASRSMRPSSAPAPTAASPTCAGRPLCWRVGGWRRACAPSACQAPWP